MDAEYYRTIIDKRDNVKTGIALGHAIKDDKINPVTYNDLCKEAKAKGFKFQYIEFQKDNY